MVTNPETYWPESHVRAFLTREDAAHYMRGCIDRPAPYDDRELPSGITHTTETLWLPDKNYSNVYVAQVPSGAKFNVEIHDTPTSMYELMRDDAGHTKGQEPVMAISGGFLYLEDSGVKQPRQSALNFAVSPDGVASLPVASRETLLVSPKGELDFKKLRAVGELSLGRKDAAYSGSLTSYDTPVKMYGNGNTVIHRRVEKGYVYRELDVESTFTGEIPESTKLCDVGLSRRAGEHSTFEVAGYRETGGMDIFAHDMVLRMPRSLFRTVRTRRDGTKRVHIDTLDGYDLKRDLRGALTMGPLFTETDFDHHPINQDASLAVEQGSAPFAAGRRLARSAIVQFDDESYGLFCFDAFPGSTYFKGVTPGEAQHYICRYAEARGTKVARGIFPDPGQTVSQLVRDGDTWHKLGNRHYLQYPKTAKGVYVHNPQSGREVASLITIHI